MESLRLGNQHVDGTRFTYASKLSRIRKTTGGDAWNDGEPLDDLADVL